MTRLIDHKGVGGFGYCVTCGLKPGNARFVPDRRAGDWDY